MSWYRWLLVSALLALLDGTWLFLALGIVGFVAGLPRAPLPWSAGELVLVIGVLVTALADIAPASWRGRNATTASLAAMTLWIAVGAGTSVAGLDVGLDWPVRVVAGDLAWTALAQVALIVLCAAYLWRHAMRRARGASVAAAVARSFRIGLAVIAVVLVLESAGELDLGTRAVLVPFFTLSLLAMALARVPVHGGLSPTWMVLAGVSVAAILGAGVTLAAVVVVLLRGGANVLHRHWTDVAREFTRSVSATLAELLGSTGGTGLDFHGWPASPPELLVLLVLLCAATIMILLVRKLLGMPPPAHPSVAIDLSLEEHEPLEDAHTRRLETLLSALGARRRRGGVPQAPELPTDPELRAVFVLYHRLLDLAHRRNIEIDPTHTPFERARRLRVELPGVPVDALTSRFVAACYAGEPTAREQIESLRNDLERATASS